MKKFSVILIICILLSTMTACSGSTNAVNQSINNSTASSQTTTGSDTSTTTETTGDTVSTTEFANTVADAVAANSESHEDATDLVWDSSIEISIDLSGDSISASSQSVVITGSIATITSAGTYRISGTLNNGQIIVDTEDKDVVRLILDGVNISSSTTSPLYISNAKKVVIILADNSENAISDAESYVYETANQDEPSASVFSKADLTIAGNGSLVVNGNFNDGITSKDGLIISNGSITVNSVDDGIIGKDYIVVSGGTVMVKSQGDGLKSDNEEDTTKGYVLIQGGVISVTSAGDAITAQTDVLISDGKLMVSSGGGSSAQIDETTSAKGLKGIVNVIIDGGNFTINSADDTLHTNGNLVINNGTFTLSSGDDGMHADSTLTVNNGTVVMDTSYEGIESVEITINGGNISILSSDDGLNGAGGNDSSGTTQTVGGPGGRKMGGGPGQDNFASASNCYIHINGGYLYVNAGGDGVDVNGALEMTDGIVIVNGPVENMNGALDYTSKFNISGGFFLAVGSAGMAMNASETSSQYSILVNLDSMQQAGSLIHIQNASGENILTFEPVKEYQSITFSSSQLANGETYQVYTGGNSTGTETNGLYSGGSYTSGNQVASFTISSIITNVGNVRQMRR